MGGLFFVLAIVVAVGVVVSRQLRRRLLEASEVNHHVVADFDDIERIANRTTCSCGRSMERRGEGPGRSGPATGGEWVVRFECVCGRRRAITFVVAN